MHFFDQNYSQFLKSFISNEFNINTNSMLLTRDYDINPYEYPKMIKPLITDEIIDKLIKKNLFFIADISYEAEYYFIDFLIDQIIIPYSLSPEQFVFIVSSKDIENYIVEKCKNNNIIYPLIVNLMFFERNMKIRLLLDFIDNREDVDELFKLYEGNPITINTGLYKNTTKKYLNLNRLWKPHRLALMTALESEDLINHGYNSFPDHLGIKMGIFKTSEEIWDMTTDKIVSKYPTLEKSIKKGITLKNKLPLVLDNSNFMINHALTSHRKLLKYFNDSWFSIVNETNHSSNQPRFLTEKTFKAIGFKHPFILNTVPNSLDFLKNLGYKTFNGIIDESYDKELNDDKRMVMIVNEVKRLCNLNQNEIIDFKIKAIPIVEYNFNHFVSIKTYFNRI